MNASPTPQKTVLSGVRPTGPLHLGNYVGALRNWVKLQDIYRCYYAIVTWHALSSEYANSKAIKGWSFEVAVDWLSVAPESGTTPAIVVATFNTAGLEAGTYIATIIFDSGRGGADRLLDVTIADRNAVSTCPAVSGLSSSSKTSLNNSHNLFLLRISVLLPSGVIS